MLQTIPDRAQLTGPFGRPDPGLPQVFGRYLLVNRLSRGGMGEIFLAKHGLAGFEKLAVIKKVLPHLAADAQFISRFVDEAQVAIKLQHVNVAQVFEVGRVGDEYFLALEYVEGRDLRRTLALLGHRKSRLPVDLALYIGREVANGLAYAHRRTSNDGSSLNLVHCDISPPNVLVSFEGETKVIDFGIAKSALRGTATDPKMGFGKFGYMAPEQLVRGGVVDHRTDIYAAGVVLYEVLTGQRLYEAGPEPDYRALAKKVTKGDHPLPSQTDPALAPYDDLVATALRPKPEDRYQSAAELRDSIQQALVAVNPTISTDQLGSYMRELFHEEMTAQRELHDRVAAAQLADFQEQMHTQTISTVSFALSQLPANYVPPPDLPAPRHKRATKQVPIRTATPTGSQSVRPARPARSTGRHPVPPPAPSPALDTVAPPTALMTPQDDDELALADGTGTAVREMAPRARTRRRAAILAALLVAGAAGVAVAMHGRGSTVLGHAPVAVIAATAPKLGPITVSPIEMPPTVSPTADGAATQGTRPIATRPGEHDAGHDRDPDRDPVRPRPVTPVGAGSEHVTDRGEHATEHAGSRDEHPKPLGAADTATKAQVAARYQDVKARYLAYKAANGEQLEDEWKTLALYLQLKMQDNFAEGLHRLDAFRDKIK